jgi:hypothetical protein
VPEGKEVSWKLPKAKPAKVKERPVKPEIPEGEEENVTGQYIWMPGRWCWCQYPSKEKK